MPKQTKQGLKEIALAADVSVATVSRVASRSNRVSPQIQERVREAALRLRIDLTLRCKTKALAFVLSNRDMLHPFHSRVLVGSQANCATRGWDIIFMSFQYSVTAPWKEIQLPRVLRRREIARAVILAGTNSQNLLELLTYREIPFAVLGNNVIGEWKADLYDRVFYDDVGGTSEMTRYLQTLGHRHIWFVGNTIFPWATRSYLGYMQAMEDAGLPPHLVTIDSMDEIEVGYLGAKTLLSRREPATAIMGATDVTVQGIYKAVDDCGLSIPDDVSVVGSNDTYAPLLHPPLTTIREFPEQLGKSLVELVLNRIAHPDLGPQQVTIPTEIVKRESCRQLSSRKEGADEGQLKGELGGLVLKSN